MLRAAQFNKGMLDDLRIYSRVLTQVQIQTDMTAPVGGTAADTVPPSTPTGLIASAVSATQINLSWNPSTDNVGVTGYQILRGGTQIGTSTTTTFSNTGLSPNTAYSYTVRAVDAAANAPACPPRPAPRRLRWTRRPLQSPSRRQRVLRRFRGRSPSAPTPPTTSPWRA